MKIKRMRPYYAVVMIACAFTVGFTALQDIEPAEMLPIGSKAPLLNDPVKDVSGKILTMGEVAKENGLLVVFSCNTCPWVAAWEDRFNPIAALAQQNDIGVIFLNPNSGSRNQGDSFEAMQQRAKKSGYKFYYAIDKNSKIAAKFGANRTPQVYLFNGDLKLVYRGAIDDNARAKNFEDIKHPYLKNAIRNMISGEKIAPETMDSFGCSIKWPEG